MVKPSGGCSLAAGDYPFDVPMDTVPDPPSDWEPSSDDDDSDDDTEATDPTDSDEQRAAWRAEKREELLEDLICDEEPGWEQAVWAADPVAADLVRGLLAKDPRARLSAAEALEHCCFTGHAAHDRATLKHAHTRVAALTESSEQLPVRCPAFGGHMCVRRVALMWFVRSLVLRRFRAASVAGSMPRRGSSRNCMTECLKHRVAGGDAAGLSNSAGDWVVEQSPRCHACRFGISKLATGLWSKTRVPATQLSVT